MLSIYKIIKPPFANCTIQNIADHNESKISMVEFKNIFKSFNESSKQKLIENIKSKLDHLIEKETEVVFDMVDHNYCQADTTDCVLYYITGFLVNKFLKKITCKNCKEGLRISKGHVLILNEAKFNQH